MKINKKQAQWIERNYFESFIGLGVTAGVIAGAVVSQKAGVDVGHALVNFSSLGMMSGFIGGHVMEHLINKGILNSAYTNELPPPHAIMNKAKVQRDKALRESTSIDAEYSFRK